MASNSSSSSAPVSSTLAQAVSEKLSMKNYLLWKAQVLAAVCDARLSGFLDGTTPTPRVTIEIELPDKIEKSEDNPAYSVWYAQDQPPIQVAMKTSAAGVWRAILGMFMSQSQARIVHLRSKLSCTCKGESTCTAYFTHMKGFTDEMVAVEKHLDDEEVICYILEGLDHEFSTFVETFMAKTEPQTLNDLFSQLLTAEACVEAPKEHQ
jgi:hypothetical protein